MFAKVLKQCVFPPKAEAVHPSVFVYRLKPDGIDG